MKVMPGMVLGDLPKAMWGFQAFELQSIVPSIGLATFFLSGFAVRSELKELGNKFDAKMDRQEKELSSMGVKLGVLDVKMGALDDKVGALDVKVGALEDKMDRQGENSFHHLQELSNGMASLGRGMGRLEGIAWRKHEVKSKSENEVMDFDD